MGRENDFGAETGNAMIGAPAQFGARITADVRRLDDIPDLTAPVIKLDVEGAEVLFLRGAERFITRQRPLILGEFNSDYMPYFGHTFADVLPMLERWEYRVVIWDDYSDPRVIDGESGTGNAMLVPAERVDGVMSRLRDLQRPSQVRIYGSWVNLRHTSHPGGVTNRQTPPIATSGAGAWPPVGSPLRPVIPPRQGPRLRAWSHSDDDSVVKSFWDRMPANAR